jgi:hypothetical protein
MQSHANSAANLFEKGAFFLSSLEWLVLTVTPKVGLSYVNCILLRVILTTKLLFDKSTIYFCGSQSLFESR